MKKYLVFLLLVALLKCMCANALVESPTMPEIRQEGESQQFNVEKSQQITELPVVKQSLLPDQSPINKPSKSIVQARVFTSSDVTIPQLSPDIRAGESKDISFDETSSGQRRSPRYSDEVSVHEAQHVTQQAAPKYIDEERQD